MSETTNYGLYLTDDSSEKFLSWREKMNGTSDSNMMKIDAALGEKAKASTIVQAVLTASSWTGDQAPYTQELSVDGMLADTNGVIDVSHDATSEQRECARAAMLAITGQDNGTLTIAADGEKPERDIPVCIILLG